MPFWQQKHHTISAVLTMKQYFTLFKAKIASAFFGVCVGVFLCSLESPLLFELANLMMLLHISEQALFLLQTENQAV